MNCFQSLLCSSYVYWEIGNGGKHVFNLYYIINSSFQLKQTHCYHLLFFLLVYIAQCISTVISGVSETGSGFHVRTAGKVQFMVFGRLLLVPAKFSFPEGDWALGNYSIKLLDFPNIS